MTHSRLRLVTCLSACLLLSGCPDSDSEDSDAGTASESATDGTATDSASTTASTTMATDSATVTDTDASATDDPTGSGTEADTDTDTDSDTDAETMGTTLGDTDSSGSTSTGEVACGAPVELGVYTPEDGDARGFEIVGDTVFLATRNGGLSIVDITDPGMPTTIGSVDVDGLAMRIAVDGDYVFIGKRGGGYSVIDANDPSMPVEVFSDDNADAQDVAVTQGVLIAPDNTGLGVYDLTDPAMPMELANDLVLPGSSETALVDGSLAYIASAAGGVSAVDFADPASPAELATFDADSNGDHIAREGTTIYYAAQDRVIAIDFSDSANPAELGSFDRERSEFVAVDQGRVFILGGDTTTTDVPFLQVVDFGDPANPVDEYSAFDELDDPEWIESDAGRVLFSSDADDALHIIDGCPTRG